jgi:hypothetical protein
MLIPKWSQTTCSFTYGKSPYGNGDCSFGHPLSLRNQYFPFCRKREAANPHMEMVNHCFHMGIQKAYGFPFPYGNHQMEIVSSKSPYGKGIQNIRLPISILDHQMGIFKSTCPFPYGDTSVTNPFQNIVCDHWGIDKKNKWECFPIRRHYFHMAIPV